MELEELLKGAGSTKAFELRDDRPAKARAKSEHAKKLSSRMATCSDLIQELDEAITSAFYEVGHGSSDDYELGKFKSLATDILKKAQAALQFEVTLSIMGLEKLSERRAIDVLAKDTERSLRENA